MKKITGYILMLVLGTMSVWAEDPEPVIVDTVVDTIATQHFLPIEYREACSNHLPQMWRTKVLDHTDTYSDTVTYTRFQPHPSLPQPVLRDTTVHDTLFVVDTIYTLDFTVNPTFSIERKLELRKGSRVEIRGKWYDQAGAYTDTIPSTTGCDSILYITIIWAESFRQVETQEICDGNSIQWHGQTLSKEGVYWDSLKTKQGYDSVYQLLLRVHYPYAKYDTTTVCINRLNQFRWHGRSFTKAGDYQAPYLDSHGCDSVFYLHLVTAFPDQNDTIEIHFCQDKGYSYKGKQYFTEAFYVDTIYNANLCESYRISHFVPDENKHIIEYLQHLPGGSVEWHGTWYTKDGVYHDTIPSAEGCDDIYELHLATRYDFHYLHMACQGETIMFQGKAITENCTIDLTLQSQFGGDSIEHHQFSFAEPFLSVEEITLCYGESYTWRDQVLTATTSQTYTDAFKSINECDSIYQLNLTVVPNNDIDTAIIACNDSIDDTHFIQWTDSKGYTWKFWKHNTDTILHDTIYYTNSLTCDSLRRHVHVIITDRCSELEQIPLCLGEEKWIDGKPYTEPGRYSNKMPSSRGLNLPDSTHTFEIYRVYPDTTVDTAFVCESQLPYIYTNGQRFPSHQSNDYTIYLKNQFGCDSVVKLRINVVPTVYSPIQLFDNYCPGDTIFVKSPTGKIFTRPGEFTDTIPYGVMGCDSVIRYKIAYKPGFYHKEARALGIDSTFIWTGHKQDTVIHTAGVYYDKHKNIYGCDSIYMLTLVYAQPYFESKSINICTSQLPLIWHGKSINETGVYWDSLQTVYQLDSVYKLTVRVDSSYRDTLHYQFCDGDVFTLKGKTITKTGVYEDTLHSVGGCDSIICHMVNFTTAMMRNAENLHIEQGQSIEWHGQIYNKPGTYYDTLRTKLGCDSIRYTMHLDVIYPYFHLDSLALCKSEMPFFWHGREFQNPGVYWDSCRTIYGLDSVYKLVLDTLPSAFYSFDVTICKGESYNFDTLVLTQPGWYQVIKRAQNGCDSTVQCRLSFAQQYLYLDGQITYTDDSELPIEWHGKKLDHEGYYFDSLKTVEYGCDSIHRVYLKKSSSYFFSEQKELCDHQLPYFWQGQNRYTAGVHTASYATMDGRDSIYQLTLVVNPSDTTVMNELMCPGEGFSLYGKTYTKPGVYTDTLVTEEGCYHFILLYLNTYNPEVTSLSHDLCPGDTLEIDGRIFTQSCTYDEHVKSILTGCDSTIHHLISFHSAFFKDERQTINPGGSYTWHKNGQPWVLTEKGTYFDSCKNAFGCDSIYRLQLTVNQVEYHFPTEVVNACESNLPYVWHGTSFYNDTTAYAKYLTKQGRDSIYTLELHVYQAKDSVVYLSYCDGESFTIKGITYTRSAQFSDTLINRFGCDSVRVHYTLNFYPQYSLTKLMELKDGECYHFGEGTPLDTLICTAGVYTRRFKSIYGCDSVVTLKVTTCQNDKDSIIRIDLCEGESFTLGGEVITEACTRAFHLKTTTGCDSTVTYYINFHPSFKNYRAVSICHGSSYKWEGHLGDTVLTKAGDYYDSIPTEAGCYNVYTLHLTYKNQTWGDTLISICEDKLPYIYKGKKYYVDSVFNDTLDNNDEGCFNILRWHYSVNHACSAYDQYTRCANEILEVDGLIITQAGVYQVEHYSSQGEDSIYRFIVNDIKAYKKYYNLEGCDSIVYKGTTFLPQPGKESYVDSFVYKSVGGCDSIEYVTFTIHKSSPVYIKQATINDYEHYLFEGEYYNRTGEYPVRLTNKDHCDSIRTLRLTVLPSTYEPTQVREFCQGDTTPVAIFQRLFVPTRDTILYDTVLSTTGATIYSVQFRMHKPFTITRWVAPDTFLCSANLLEFPVSYSVADLNAKPEYYEVEWTNSIPYVLPRKKKYPILNSNEITIYMEGDGTSIDPGYYTYRVTFSTTSCSTTATYNGAVEIRYPAEIMKAKWNNMVTLRNADYNPGHWNLQPPYTWRVSDQAGNDKTGLIAPNTNQSYIVSDQLRNGDEVIIQVYREGYTQAIKSCPFIFQGQGTSSTEHPVVVYPTITPKRSSIHIQSELSGKWNLFNPTGNKHTQGELLQGDNLIPVPASTGCYLLQVTLQNGESQLERIIIY